MKKSLIVISTLLFVGIFSNVRAWAEVPPIDTTGQGNMTPTTAVRSPVVLETEATSEAVYFIADLGTAHIEVLNAKGRAVYAEDIVTAPRLVENIDFALLGRDANSNQNNNGATKGKIVPGTYTIQVDANGRTWTQTFEVSDTSAM